MGEVYRARDAKLARDVAIKVLPAEFALDPDRLARFTREAQVLASLNHQNIAGIYGSEQGPAEAGPHVHALVLEYVDGPTLADRIAQGAIPVDEALPIARQVAEALEVAHEQGIIHRDLKPANIKVRPDGTVKVLDFGLAKLATGATHAGSKEQDPAYTVSPTITTPAMTQVGMILGTAAYMSPEQAKGREADKRSDVWAFGCVLYEMLTGTRAFVGDDVSDTLAAVLRADPNWTALPADLPQHIRSLLQRCLRRDAQKRLPHIAMARFEIVEAPDSAAQVTPVPTVKPTLVRRAMPVAIGTVVAAAITSGVWWTLRTASTPPIVTKFTITLPEGQRFSVGSRRNIDVSPDGTQIVYTANQRLYRRALWETEATPVEGAGGSVGSFGSGNPFFSFDGRSISFIASVPGGVGLMKVPSGGGTAQPLATVIDTPSGISWGRDGILMGQGARGIQRVSEKGGMPETLVTVRAGETASYPQMLPDGDSLLYTHGITDTAADYEIVVRSLKSGSEKTLIKLGSDARYLTSGHIAYAVGGVLYAVPFDVKRLMITGEQTAVVQGVRRGGGSAHYSVSNTGTLVYVPGSAAFTEAQGDLAFIDRKGQIERLNLPPASYEAPRVSPDGTQAAVSSREGGERNISIIDLSSEKALRKLTLGGSNRFPIWSRDGKRVAYQSDREGALAIFWQLADGTDRPERLTKPSEGASHVPDSFSPVSDVLLFSETKGGETSSWTLSLPDKNVKPFGNLKSQLPINAAFSPDGKWVTYQLGRSGENAVYVHPFPTGQPYQISKGLAHHPVWSRDGKEVIFLPAQALPLVVLVTTQPSFSFSNNPLELPRKGLESGPNSIRNFDVMPDGRLFGVVNGRDTASGTANAQEIR